MFVCLFALFSKQVNNSSRLQDRHTHFTKKKTDYSLVKILIVLGQKKKTDFANTIHRSSFCVFIGALILVAMEKCQKG